ncbi:hypothetical protein [Agromyces sp. NPDC049794]|uniref:hypothetical protein n=1 Tax=unclassified Agromyces TaxID=2639701 RepID=UPI0033C9DF2C
MCQLDVPPKRDLIVSTTRRLRLPFSEIGCTVILQCVAGQVVEAILFAPEFVFATSWGDEGNVERFCIIADVGGLAGRAERGRAHGEILPGSATDRTRRLDFEGILSDNRLESPFGRRRRLCCGHRFPRSRRVRRSRSE